MNTTITIDTHDAVEALIAGDFSKKQAEAVVHTIRSVDLSHLATRQDVRDMEHQLKALEYRLTNKIIGASLATVIATVSVLRYLGG